MGKSQQRFKRREQAYRQRQRDNSRSGFNYAAAAAGAGIGLAASKAGADVINSFSQLMNSSSSQGIRNYDNDENITGEFTINGETPTQQNYDFGGFTPVQGGAIVTGYIENDSFSGYPQVLNGAYDRGRLGIDGKPDYWLVVQKNTGRIGELTNGSLVIDEENNVWTNDMIEYNGVKGAAEQMPGCTSSGEIDSHTGVNLIPEPTSAAILGAGALTLIGKGLRNKIGGLVSKIKGN